MHGRRPRPPHRYENDGVAESVADALQALVLAIPSVRGEFEKEYAELLNTVFDATQPLYAKHGIVMEVRR